MDKEFTIQCHDKSFSVPKAFINLCGHLKLIVEDETFESDSIQINAQQVTPAIFEEILRYFSIHNGNPTIGINKLVSHKLEDNMSPEDIQFICKYDVCKGDDLANLEKAATFLQIEPLQELISLTVATEIYFDGTYESFDEMKRRNEISGETTVDEEQRYRETYIWVHQYDHENLGNKMAQMGV